MLDTRVLVSLRTVLRLIDKTLRDAWICLNRTGCVARHWLVFSIVPARTGIDLRRTQKLWRCVSSLHPLMRSLEVSSYDDKHASYTEWWSFISKQHTYLRQTPIEYDRQAQLSLRCYNPLCVVSHLSDLANVQTQNCYRVLHCHKSLYLVRTPSSES